MSLACPGNSPNGDPSPPLPRPARPFELQVGDARLSRSRARLHTSHHPARRRPPARRTGIRTGGAIMGGLCRSRTQGPDRFAPSRARRSRRTREARRSASRMDEDGVAQHTTAPSEPLAAAWTRRFRNIDRRARPARLRYRQSLAVAASVTGPQPREVVPTLVNMSPYVGLCRGPPGSASHAHAAGDRSRSSHPGPSGARGAGRWLVAGPPTHPGCLSRAEPTALHSPHTTGTADH